MRAMMREVRWVLTAASLSMVACTAGAPVDEDPGLPGRRPTETPSSPSSNESQPPPSDATEPEPVPVDVSEPAPAGEPISARERQWTWVPVEGTRCMNGTSTGIGVNLSSKSSDVVIVLEGGGACFDTATCTAGTIHQEGFNASTFGVVMAGMGFTGILNRNLPQNPLRDFNYVFVPYCTGDVHAGNNPSGPGGRMHVGFENIRRDLERIVPTFKTAKRVVLTGSSAGGVGAGFNYDQVQRAFGETPVLLLDDSGPVLSDTYLKPCVQKRFRESWGMNDTLPKDCADCRNADGGGLINMAKYIGRTYPKSRFAMISSTGDAVMRTFFSFGYSKDCSTLSYFPARDFESGLMELRSIAASMGAKFHVFYPRSEMHTWLLTDAGLFMRAGGVALHEWIDGFVNDTYGWGDAVP